MAKYTFENTSVADMLDKPEIRALVEKIMPAVLEHPMLEVGRSFIFADAIPYIEDMTSPEELAQFKEELEALE